VRDKSRWKSDQTPIKRREKYCQEKTFYRRVLVVRLINGPSGGLDQGGISVEKKRDIVKVGGEGLTVPQVPVGQRGCARVKS